MVAVVLPADSLITKFDIVIKSVPVILKNASRVVLVPTPAVIVLPLPAKVIVLATEPPVIAAVIEYPPAGAVCGLAAFRVIVTGPDIAVTLFTA